MTCAEIQELIVQGSEPVEAHTAGCETCREYLEAARKLDSLLAAPVRAPARLKVAILSAVNPRPSYLPEVFDFVAWAAMVTVAIGLAREFLATYWN